MFAKASVRLSKPAFDVVKSRYSGPRPKDRRAIRLLSTRLARKMNSSTFGTNYKKAFLRWHIVSKPSILRHSVQKLAVVSKINELVAIYRMLAVVRGSKKIPFLHSELPDNCEKLDKLYESLQDKYNSKARLLKRAFASVKNTHIRSSRLMAVETLLQRLLERYSFQSESFCKIRSKPQLLDRIARICCFTYARKVQTAMTKLLQNHAIHNHQILTDMHNEDDLDLVRKIILRSLKKKVEKLQARVKASSEAAHALKAKLEELFRNRKASALNRIKYCRSSLGHQKVVRVDNALDRFFRREKDHGLIKIMEFSGVRDRASRWASTFDIQMKSSKTVEISNRRDIMTEALARMNQTLVQFGGSLEHLKMVRMSDFWRKFYAFSQTKEMRNTSNYFSRWVIRVFGVKSNSFVKRNAQIVRANMLLMRMLKNNGRTDMRYSYYDIKSFAYIKYQMQKPVDFKRDMPTIKLLIRLSQKRTRLGFFAIVGYSHLVIKLQSVTLVHRKLASQLQKENHNDLLLSGVQSNRVRRNLRPPKDTPPSAAEAEGRQPEKKLKIEDLTLETLSKYLEDAVLFEPQENERIQGDLITKGNSNFAKGLLSKALHIGGPMTTTESKQTFEFSDQVSKIPDSIIFKLDRKNQAAGDRYSPGKSSDVNSFNFRQKPSSKRTSPIKKPSRLLPSQVADRDRAWENEEHSSLQPYASIKQRDPAKKQKARKDLHHEQDDPCLDKPGPQQYSKNVSQERLDAESDHRHNSRRSGIDNENDRRSHKVFSSGNLPSLAELDQDKPQPGNNQKKREASESKLSQSASKKPPPSSTPEQKRPGTTAHKEPDSQLKPLDRPLRETEPMRLDPLPKKNLRVSRPTEQLTIEDIRGSDFKEPALSKSGTNRSELLQGLADLMSPIQIQNYKKFTVEKPKAANHPSEKEPQRKSRQPKTRNSGLLNEPKPAEAEAGSLALSAFKKMQGQFSNKDSAQQTHSVKEANRGARSIPDGYFGLN